ncbi:MAG: hypothetical protein CM1200mP39_11380 [Dehalococcoidia bacterium]|nr:MAG: hypothetical protein CM1200mP39_11380 [Dehalococcoidia bacterium]
MAGMLASFSMERPALQRNFCDGTAQVKEDAEAKLGEQVDQAVITVPAYFSDSQREATKLRVKLRGLKF